MARYRKQDNNVWVRTDGIDSNNYSAEELIIGTWFGKPLYRKSFKFTSPSSASGSITISHNLGIEDTISCYGAVKYNNTNTVTLISNPRNEYAIYAVPSTNSLSVRYQNVTDSNLYGKNAYITLEYTKTTD